MWLTLVSSRFKLNKIIKFWKTPNFQSKKDLIAMYKTKLAKTVNKSSMRKNICSWVNLRNLRLLTQFEHTKKDSTDFFTHQSVSYYQGKNGITNEISHDCVSIRKTTPSPSKKLTVSTIFTIIFFSSRSLVLWAGRHGFV